MLIKFNLKEMIHKINWTELNKGGGWENRELKNDSLTIGYFKSGKKRTDLHKNYANYLRIRLGANLIEQLNWEIGDKIDTLHDPDDIMSILLVKTDKLKGRKLLKESKSLGFTIYCKWIHHSVFPLQKMPSKEVEFEIYEKYIHFRLPAWS